MQRDVLRDRELEHEPAPLAVLGDMPHSRVEHLPGRGVAELAACDPNRAAPHRAQARDRVDQLGLPVAVDARDADDLAGANVE